MKMLGLLFVVCVLIGAVGYFRGWFAVTTVDAGDKGGVTFTIDKEKLADDAHALKDKLPSKVEDRAAMQSADVEGVLVAIDAAARNLSLTVGSETIVQHVQTGVPIDRNGVGIGIEDLRINMRVKLLFVTTNQQRTLDRVEIL